ncbi:MAG: RnfABCDGE type electron transport complex subunit D [Desulfovibrionaceae bacterium]
MPVPSPLLTVSCAPHIHSGRTLRKTMLETVAVLLPTAILAMVNYGLPAARVMALSCATAVAVETLCTLIMEREIEVDDLNGLFIGLLLAFLLPASAPWWLVMTGATLSIVAGKAIFGGLGGSPLCAPCVGWAILTISWPDLMDTELSLLASSFAAPLHQLKHFGYLAVEDFNLLDGLLGKQVGGLGAVEILPLLAAGVWLSLRRQIKWLIPLGFLTGLILLSTFFHYSSPDEYAPPLFHLLTGSAVFAAFFLAPDNSSSPMRALPMFLFGLIAGILLVIIRVWGVYPDGAPFAVLLANLLSPLLDRIRPKPFGAGTGAL